MTTAARSLNAAAESASVPSAIPVFGSIPALRNRWTALWSPAPAAVTNASAVNGRLSCPSAVRADAGVSSLCENLAIRLDAAFVKLAIPMTIELTTSAIATIGFSRKRAVMRSISGRWA